MEKRNWEQCDFVYVTGDAYVDHPSFGHAIISRILESHGYKVGIIAQPDWKNADSVRILGEPRLGYLVSAGNSCQFHTIKTPSKNCLPDAVPLILRWFSHSAVLLFFGQPYR